MAAETEYAKLITSYIPGTIYGIRTVVTIPTETWVGWKVKTNGNGYLDAYLSLDRGSLHYECGLSVRADHAHHYGLYDEDGDGLWHYFWAAGSEGGGGSAYTLAPGRQVPIELSINSSNQLVYKVDYNTVQTFKATSDAITRARLVIGACEQEFLSTNQIPDQNPLTEWGTFHTQIACRNFAYQTTRGGAWTLFDTTGRFNRVYWPTGYSHDTNPNDFVVVPGNGSLIASLKKPL